MNGEVTDTAYYDSYGNVISRTGTTYTPYWYVGRYGVEVDGDGLYYMRARYYNPKIQRFVNVDPVRDGYNWYGYGNGNPVNGIDPSGTQSNFDYIQKQYIEQYFSDMWRDTKQAVHEFPGRVVDGGKKVAVAVSNKYKQTSNALFDIFVQYDDPSQYTAEGVAFEVKSPILLLDDDSTNDEGWYGFSGVEFGWDKKYEFEEEKEKRKRLIDITLVSGSAKFVDISKNTRNYSWGSTLVGANADAGIDENILGASAGAYLYDGYYEKKIDIFDTGIMVVIGVDGAVGLGATFDLSKGRYEAAFGPGAGIRFGFKRRYSSYGFECETD